MLRIYKRKHVVQIMRRHHSTLEAKKFRQIFSAIQPTGEAHLGNYLGALKKWVDFQNSEEYKVIFGIADLHSITLPKVCNSDNFPELKSVEKPCRVRSIQEPKELQRNILVMAATLLACGINTDKAILFQQSSVRQHAELCWILGTLTTMSQLSHLPQFKEKSAEVKQAPVGIFMYPVLQAADIMLYRTTHVPVGADQSQQINFGNHLIRVFNNRFGSTFPVPEPIIDSSFGRIKSLADPTKKMSKSDSKSIAYISLMDEPEKILNKVKKALSDFESNVTYDPDNRPGISNLISIHSGLTGKTPDEIVQECADLDTGKYKLFVAEVVIEKLKPIREKIIEYLNSEEYLLSELEKGDEKAQEIAEETMKEVKERVGLNLLKMHTNVNQKKKTSVL